MRFYEDAIHLSKQVSFRHVWTGRAQQTAEIVGQWIPDCWTGRREGLRTKRAATNTRYGQSMRMSIVRCLQKKKTWVALSY